MNERDWKLWNDVTFKTNAYRKNFDIINDNENFITEYEGVITKIRNEEQKLPVQMGEYGFSVWHIELGNKFNVNFNKLINDHSLENTYSELAYLIKKKKININDYKKIVLIHTFILSKEYRKCGITEEFIEMIYRDFYANDIAIFALVKPIQDNPIDADYFFKQKNINIKESLKNPNIVNIPAIKYYSLDELIEKKDSEINEYKLFAIAKKCGFNRINESYLFQFSPEIIENRMKEKQKFSQNVLVE